MEKKQMTIHGIPSLVTFTGQGRPLLCLHGWGKQVDYHAFDELREAMQDAQVQIIVPDFPGFGESAEPPKAWPVDDYADFVEDLVRQLNIENVMLLGHSFGGRVALKLAARQLPWMTHLSLCAAAGVGRDLLIRRKFWLFVAKVGNVFCSLPGIKQLKPIARKLLYKLLRARDYYDASERMRETMAVVVEEDLTPCLEKIQVPTDLFWGEADTITPLKDGELMNKKIAQSTLHTYAEIRHRVHRHKAQEIATVLKTKL